MRCPLPIIARVQRAAFGGALGFICASDFAIAAEGRVFRSQKLVSVLSQPSSLKLF